MTAWEEFYANTPKPLDLDENELYIKNFVNHHSLSNSKIALVTSGGTTVPLEHNTVRYVDNFSAGTRGSSSTEYFLENGYAVIFLYRLKSLEPFTRHFSGSQFLDMLDFSGTDESPIVEVSTNYVEKVAKVLRKYKKVVREKKLLKIGFTTLSEYLWLLRCVCQYLAAVEKFAILYLAAAVSDFYVPSNEMSVHKIPSSTGPPTISLQLVPKVLQPLVSLWVPKAFVISFKLETDESILIDKAIHALNNYNHNLVIANMLQTRKQQVIIVSKEKSSCINLADKQFNDGNEIEYFIVKDVTLKHEEWINKQ